MVLPMFTILTVGSLSWVGKKYGLNVFVGHCTYKILHSDWMLNNHKIFLCIFIIEISKNVLTSFFTHVHLSASLLRWPLKQSCFQLLGQVCETSPFWESQLNSRLVCLMTYPVSETLCLKQLHTIDSANKVI